MNTENLGYLTDKAQRKLVMPSYYRYLSKGGKNKANSFKVSLFSSASLSHSPSVLQSNQILFSPLIHHDRSHFGTFKYAVPLRLLARPSSQVFTYSCTWLTSQVFSVSLSVISSVSHDSLNQVSLLTVYTHNALC